MHKPRLGKKQERREHETLVSDTEVEFFFSVTDMSVSWRV